ncbi:MAG TPA: hypothetical protein VIK75_05440 [Calditerricola sp.]
MGRRKIPVTIYLEPEQHKHLQAIATQYQKSIAMTGKDLLLKAMAEEHRPLTVNERLERLEKAVAEIRVFLKMDSGEEQDGQNAQTKANAKTKAKS